MPSHLLHIVTIRCGIQTMIFEVLFYIQFMDRKKTICQYKLKHTTTKKGEKIRRILVVHKNCSSFNSNISNNDVRLYDLCELTPTDREIRAMVTIDISTSGFLFGIGICILLITKTMTTLTSWFDHFTIRCGKFYSALCMLSSSFGFFRDYEISHGMQWFVIVGIPHTIGVLLGSCIALPILFISVTQMIVKEAELLPKSILHCIYLLEVVTVQFLALWIVSPS